MTTSCSLSNKTYSLDNHGEIELDIRFLHPLYEPEDLFTMALRHSNSRRSFLFVSKILGKHIPITPCTLVEATEHLSRLWLGEYFGSDVNTISEPLLVIGFAETATAMGHALFSHLEGNVSYLHSTREHSPDISPVLYACESHSHATDHDFYLTDRKLITGAKHILVVDDEITSGRTALELIRAIDEQFPGKEYSVASFLDWRTKDNRNAFLAGINGREVKAVSLLRGEVVRNTLWSPSEKFLNSWNKNDNPISFKTIELPFTPSDYRNESDRFMAFSGRFGMGREDQEKLEREISSFGHEIRRNRDGGKTLFLGRGECMYIPLRLAMEAGENVFFHATTRSPAWPSGKNASYGIKNGISFEALDGSTYREYVYNILDRSYDELFLVTENRCCPERLKTFMQFVEGAGIKNIKHVILGSGI
ncbi:MAG: phosphoribosyltransferase family protein [Chitinispirillaceae bacterium]